MPTLNHLSSPTIITIKPLTHKDGYVAVRGGLIGDATYGPGGGGWQTVDRPKLVSATQWMTRSPFTLDMDLILDKSITSSTQKDPFMANNPSASSSVEPICTQLESWMDKIENTLLPPILRVTGPIPGISKFWVLNGLSFKEALRDRDAGFRYQQTIHVSLMEYVAPLKKTYGNYNTSPTSTYRDNYNNTGAQSLASHIWKQGDTIDKVAANFSQGDLSFGNKILKYNNVQDPRLLLPGQILIIPRPNA
jgi:hypothetical protein